MSLEKKKLKECIKKILCRKDLEVRRDALGTYIFSLPEKENATLCLFDIYCCYEVRFRFRRSIIVGPFFYLKYFYPLIKKHEKYLAMKAKEEKERLEMIEIAELQKLIDELE